MGGMTACRDLLRPLCNKYVIIHLLELYRVEKMCIVALNNLCNEVCSMACGMVPASDWAGASCCPARGWRKLGSINHLQQLWCSKYNHEALNCIIATSEAVQSDCAWQRVVVIIPR